MHPTRRRFLLQAAAAPPSLPDLSTVAPDLTIPPLESGPPRSGARVRGSLLAGTSVYHVLYLPPDWRPGRRYPLIVEYAGNGNYRNQYGDISEGIPEGSRLGYGISGGRGWIWLCLPYVDAVAGRNAITWWGDVDATVDYCERAVAMACREYGADPRRVLLCGFSRGAIACNYIGLRNGTIAKLWRGFVCYSHYDGVRPWPYADSDRASALTRLRRLQHRPQFICHENGGVAATRAYLESTGVRGRFTFRDVPFRNHSDAWVLRPGALRDELRQWVWRI